jgi:hypothetical protein
MSDTAELTPAELTPLEAAAIAPEKLMQASLGTLPDSTRDAGLILTKAQVIDLKRYASKAILLPTEIKGVIAYLGYDSDRFAGNGLAPDDFAKCFTKVNNHAQKWSDLERRVKNVSAELKVFANSMSTYGKSVDKAIADIKGVNTLRQLGIVTFEDLKRVQIEMGDSFPGIEFDAHDAEAAETFGFVIEKILKKVIEHQEKTEELKDDLTLYGDELSNVVRPAIKLQLVALENSDLEGNIVELQKEIDDLNKQIDEKSKAYKKLVESSLGSAASMNIVGLGMAIYLGTQAENIRKERNNVKADRDIKAKEMYGMHKTLGRLGYIKADLQDLEMLSIEADCATKNLITVWNRLHTYVKQSKEEAETINDAMRASIFAYQFQQVVAPWGLVLKEADQLLNVFEEAEAAIKQDTTY